MKYILIKLMLVCSGDIYTGQNECSNVPAENILKCLYYSADDVYTNQNDACMFC